MWATLTSQRPYKGRKRSRKSYSGPTLPGTSVPERSSLELNAQRSSQELNAECSSLELNARRSSVELNTQRSSQELNAECSSLELNAEGDHSPERSESISGFSSQGALEASHHVAPPCTPSQADQASPDRSGPSGSGLTPPVSGPPVTSLTARAGVGDAEQSSLLGAGLSGPGVTDLASGHLVSGPGPFRSESTGHSFTGHSLPGMTGEPGAR